MKLTALLSVVVFHLSLFTRHGITEETRNTLLDFVKDNLEKLDFPMKETHKIFGSASRSLSDMTFIRQALYPDKCWKRGLGTIVPFRLNLTTGMRKAWCDTQSFGGGAIVIQKHSATIEEFQRNWTEYARGFGEVYGDFWLGNNALHELTQKNKWKLKIEGSKFTRHYYAIYDLFKVGPPNDAYRVTVGKLQNGTESLRSRRYRSSYDINNMKFTTIDRDNDHGRTRNCAGKGNGGFWYNNCAEISPNGWNGKMDDIEMKRRNSIDSSVIVVVGLWV